MGISGLLPLLKDISTTTHISKFSGLTLGVDAYVWLHRGAYGCAQEVVLGKETTRYVDYAIHRVRMLKHFNITPYIVFDGDNLPSKLHTENDRERRRAESLARARTLLREERFKEAREVFAKCIDITPEMAYQLIKALKAEGVSYVVAPYEADAQLTFLESVGLIDGIITEDSDLLVFGCKRVLFKFDSDGNCEEVLASRLGQVKTLSFVGWGIKEFRQMAILSGCDYLPSITGMGLKKAHALLRRCKTIEKSLQIVRFDGNMKVPQDYAMEFRRAELTFEHQRVFDPRGEDGGQLSFLNPLPEGVNDTDMPFIGARIDDEVARGIARGEIDPNSREKMKDIAPNFKPHLNSPTKANYSFKAKPKASTSSSKPSVAPNRSKSKSTSPSKSTSQQIQGQSSLLKFLRPKPEASSSSSTTKASSSKIKVGSSNSTRSPLKNLNHLSQSSLSSSPMMLTESQEATLESEEEAFKLQKEKKPISMETTSRFFQGKSKKVEVAPESEELEYLDEVMEDDSEEKEEKEKEETTGNSLASRFTFQPGKVALKRKRSNQLASPEEEEVVVKERKEETSSEHSSDQAPLSDQDSKGVENDDSGIWQEGKKEKSSDGEDEWDCEDLEGLISGKGWTPTAQSKLRNIEDRKSVQQAEVDKKGIEEEGSGIRHSRGNSHESEVPSLNSSPLANKRFDKEALISDQMQGVLEDDKSDGVLSSPFSVSEAFQTSKPHPLMEQFNRTGYGSPVSPLQERNLKSKSISTAAADENQDPFNHNGFDRLSKVREDDDFGFDEASPSSDPIESDSSPSRPELRFNPKPQLQPREIRRVSSGNEDLRGDSRSDIDGQMEGVEEIDEDEEEDEEEKARIELVSRGLRERFTFQSPTPNQINLGNPNHLSRTSSSSSSFRLGAGPSHFGRTNSHSSSKSIKMKSTSTPKLQFQESAIPKSRSINKRSLSFDVGGSTSNNEASSFHFEKESKLKRMGAHHLNEEVEGGIESPSPSGSRAKRLESKVKSQEVVGKKVGDSKSGLEQFRFVGKKSS